MFLPSPITFFSCKASDGIQMDSSLALYSQISCLLSILNGYIQRNQWQRKNAKPGGTNLPNKKYFYGKKLKSLEGPLKSGWATAP